MIRHLLSVGTCVFDVVFTDQSFLPVVELPLVGGEVNWRVGAGRVSVGAIADVSFGLKHAKDDRKYKEVQDAED